MKFNKILYFINFILILNLIYFIFASSAQPFIFIIPINVSKIDIILSSLVHLTEPVYKYPRYLTLFITFIIIHRFLSLLSKKNRTIIISVLIVIFGCLLFQVLYKYQIPYFNFKAPILNNKSYNLYYLSMLLLVMINVTYNLVLIISFINKSYLKLKQRKTINK